MKIESSDTFDEQIYPTKILANNPDLEYDTSYKKSVSSTLGNF